MKGAKRRRGFWSICRSVESKKSPAFGGALDLHLHQLSQWIAVSSSPKVEVFSISSNGSRRHKQLYFSAETLELYNSGLILKARVSVHALPAPDSRSKLATAVTRARVDHPSFLCYSAPSHFHFPIWRTRITLSRTCFTKKTRVGYPSLVFSMETETCN